MKRKMPSWWSVHDLMQALNLSDRTYDTAVPQYWFDANPGKRAIWMYDKRAPIFGRPVLLTALVRLYNMRNA